MSFEFKDGRFYEAIWFVGCGDSDWMAAVWRDLPDGNWQLTYRFRYYADDKIGEHSKDTKNWYCGEANSHSDEARAQVVAACDMVAAITAKTYGGRVSRLALATDNAQAIMARLLAQPWAHPVANARGGLT